MRHLICIDIPRSYCGIFTDILLSRRATEDSILAVQVFDQKKFKKKDQGFLGVINVRVGDVVDFSSGEDGTTILLYLSIVALITRNNRNAHSRLEEIKR
jgi:hypothetical protein